MMEKHFKNFDEFYPFYLSQHQNPMCRVLHFVGTSLVVSCLIYILWMKYWIYLLLLPFVGYIPAWIGHFFFEKNKPATFRHPLWSLRADFVMFGKAVLGNRKK